MPETEILGRKRHATLLKKAQELSILCDAEVAVIAFTSDGKLHEYSSNRVEHTLSRYKNYKGRGIKMEPNHQLEERRRGTVSNEEHPKSSDEVLHALEGQHAALELDKLRRTGKALDGLSREELYALEQEQKGALVSVLKKKEELLVRSKEREHQAIQEKEILRRGFEKRTKKIPCLQLFPENSTGLCTISKAVALSNSPAQDMDIDFLRLRL
ncbi:hypothetical protein ACLB2K_048965 [Fragaria x ananassa]